MLLKVSSVKWQPFCSGGDELKPLKLGHGWVITSTVLCGIQWNMYRVLLCFVLLWLYYQFQYCDMINLPRAYFLTSAFEVFQALRILPLSNYADPVYGVATICHQVRWLHWGHPSLFHTTMSLLIWNKMFCMSDISCRLIWMKYINMLSVYAQSGTHRPFNWLIIAVFT